MRKVVVSCQKGGVGKTTTALNLGAYLASRKKRVLFVDLDLQGNLTDTMGATMGGPSSMELLTGKMPAAETVQRAGWADIVPAGPALAGADTIQDSQRQTLLARALHSLQANYDFCVIDTPPALGLLTVSALTAAHHAIVTAQADPYSLRALGQLSLTLDAIRTRANTALEVVGILLTRHNTRAILTRDMAAMMEQTAGALHTSLFKTTIREAVAIKESQAVQQNIFQYAPRSAVAGDYKAFCLEYLHRTK